MAAKSKIYMLQNKVIHKARQELENSGKFNPWSGMEELRAIAAEISGVPSVSKLSVDQRAVLIDRLIAKGANVRNPTIEPRRSSKVVVFGDATEAQLAMIDALAAKIHWHTPDGFARFCRKVIFVPRPVTTKHITRMRLALQSLIDQQAKAAS